MGQSSRDEVDVGPRLNNEHHERGENAGDRATAFAMWNPTNN